MSWSAMAPIKILCLFGARFRLAWRECIMNYAFHTSPVQGKRMKNIVSY